MNTKYFKTFKSLKYLKILCILNILVILINNEVCGQDKDFAQLPSLPSTIVFDLLTDIKGFLWVAHDGGISKYDGISFTNYYNPEQTSLSATDLFEDKFGRIWFHNFNGQIFYVANNKINLLVGYDYKRESNFPRIGIYKDQLLATSKFGLFVCDIKTLECHYEHSDKKFPSSTTSLSITNNGVIVYGNRKWFYYEKNKGLKQISFNRKDSLIINADIGILNAKSFKDTTFYFSNPLSILYKIGYKNGVLVLYNSKQYNNFINTISVQNDGYWVNTTRFSIKIPQNKVVDGLNLSSIIGDKEGNQWYGSLLRGLLTNNKSGGIFDYPYNFKIKQQDFIKCIIKDNNKLIIGTQFGSLIGFDTISKKSEILINSLPKNNSIYYLKKTNKNIIIIGSPGNTYFFDLNKKKIIYTYSNLTITQCDTIYNSFVFATSSGLMVVPINKSNKLYEKWKIEFLGHFHGFIEKEELIGKYKVLIWPQRIMGTSCISKNKTIWCASKNGLITLSKKGIFPFLFQNKPVYATSLTKYRDKLIVGTINLGILIIEDNKIKQIRSTINNFSEKVLKIKVLENNLWIFNAGFLQVLDLNNYKVINNLKLPGINDGIINEVEELNKQPIFANLNGIYKIPILKNNYRIKAYLDIITDRNNDTLTKNNFQLPYYDNELNIKLQVPLLKNGKDAAIKYRLITNEKSGWLYGEPGERNFRLLALKPGKYKFEALANILQTNITSNPVIIDFEITPPYWLTWWFLLLITLFISLSIFSVTRFYYRNILAKEKADYEKLLAIELERDRISNDIHDDIGANLSAIKLFTSTVVNSKNPEVGINKIQEMISDLSFKIKEIIWSLNRIYDDLQSLINFIVNTSIKIYENSQISLTFDLPTEIPDLKISSEKRNEVYLTIKESLNNIIKHSKADIANLRIEVKNNILIFEVSDNGIGFQNHKTIGLGIKNMRKRVEKLGGKFLINSMKGTIVIIEIPFKSLI